MDAKIVTLSENTAGMDLGLLGEHGLSIYVETPGFSLLFDTGQTVSAAHNAEVLGIDLKGVPIALSHGHVDHTGGLKSVLGKTGPTEVFCHPDVFAQKYALKDGKLIDIGLPKTRPDLERMGSSFKISRKPRQLSEGVWLTGEVPRRTDFEQAEDYLLVRDPVQRVDPLLDDQALVLDLNRGLLVVLGCAHGGVVNTIEQARKITGKSRVLGVIGGTHLGFGSTDMNRLERTIEALKHYELEILGVSHCTGIAAAARLATEFRDQFIFNTAGNIIEL